MDPSLYSSRDPKVIPPPSSSRCIVMCFDATAGRSSSIVELFSLLQKDTQQLTYYQGGVGYTYRGSRSPMLKLTTYLPRRHVLQGYRFLMNNYQKGDRICIFGVSHGAFLARSLVGMLGKVGLLGRGAEQLIPVAYTMFKDNNKQSWLECDSFKKTYATEVRVKFVGVWNTRKFPSLFGAKIPIANLDIAIDTFRHALALDERRSVISPLFYQQTTSRRAATEGSTMEIPATTSRAARIPVTASVSIPTISGVEEPTIEAETSAAGRAEVQSKNSSKQTDVLEVWFAGSHLDVCGLTNEATGGLGRISLLWMIRECDLTGSGIRFDNERLRAFSLESEGPAAPAIQRPIHDPLERWSALWLFEFLPLFQLLPKGDGTWRTVLRWVADLFA